MAGTKDLWTVTVKGPDGKPSRQRTARYGHGKRWLAAWIGMDGREQTKAFAKKAEADRYGAAQETDAAPRHHPRHLWAPVARPGRVHPGRH